MVIIINNNSNKQSIDKFARLQITKVQIIGNEL